VITFSPSVHDAKNVRYVVISPVRDEAEFLARTIQSMLQQTVKPLEWIIVNDGSTDQTGSIADSFAGTYSWIRVIHRPNRGFRKSGGGVVEAFNEGYSALRCDPWDFIVKLDGDLSFSDTYFQNCFERFYKDTKLGITGGDIHHFRNGKWSVESNPAFHVRGATKIYRKQCWDAIGGLWPAPGWDTIDEVKANMLGWTTYSLPELKLCHYRETGTADGLVRDRVKHGTMCYIAGYHPLFLLASCARRLMSKPYILGSTAILYGFVSGYFRNLQRVDDTQFIRYLRSQQLRRLCGLDTIWR
jgi:biofilm PGA synthesis N-glycosyltransferase PgaC